MRRDDFAFISLRGGLPVAVLFFANGGSLLYRRSVIFAHNSTIPPKPFQSANPLEFHATLLESAAAILKQIKPLTRLLL